MAQPIDYSKWDYIEESDQSNGSDPEDMVPSCSSVARLSSPSAVCIGPGGASIVNPHVSNPFGKQFRPLDSAPVTDRSEDDILYDCLTKNGAKEGESHMWSQTDDSATISFLVPLDLRSKDISGFRIHEVDVVRDGVALRRPRIEFSYRMPSNVAVTITNDFYYPLKLDSDLLDGCWELKTIHNQRFLIVQVFKMSVAAGVVIWWDRCFSTDINLLNTSTIQSRKSAQSQRFQQVWEEAHDLFRQRMAERRAHTTS